MAISKRVKTVREHVKAENAGDLDAALATFKHPRYEYVATDEIYDGPEEILAHWRELNRAFPDQQTEIVKLRRADDTVVMEGIFRGTHTGPLRGLPPTGRSFEHPFLAVFVFDGDDLIGERVYYDTTTLLRQLGVARELDSLTGRLETVAGHPLTIGRGLVRRVIGR
jgi:steroid delta-isomerase-like uncharacterized protein